MINVCSNLLTICKLGLYHDFEQSYNMGSNKSIESMACIGTKLGSSWLTVIVWKIIAWIYHQPGTS